MSVAARSLRVRMASGWREDRTAFLARLAVVPAVIVTVAFFLIPMGRLVQISFFRHLVGTLMEPAFTFDNYTRFFTDSYFLGRLLQTAYLGLVVTGLCFLLGFPLAYMLVRGQLPARGLLFGIVLFPLVTNSLALVFSWFVLLGHQGPVSDLANAIGLAEGPVRILGTPWAVILAMTHAGLPFMIIPLMAALSGIPPSLEDVAVQLGAPRRRVFTSVIMPMALPGIVSGSIITFATVLAGFLFPLYLGGNSTNILPLLIYQNVSITVNWPFGSALTFITLMLSFVVVGVGLLSIRVARTLSLRRTP